MNFFFVSGPHGAGKTTRLERIKEEKIVIPELRTAAPKFHTQPLERIVLKLCERAIENYELKEIAKEYPEKIIVGNRCIYDHDAYALAYKELGWITQKQYQWLERLARKVFPKELHTPYALVFNPPFEIIEERLKSRWMKEKKWQEENKEYCKAAHESYKQFKEREKILYLESWESKEELFPLLEKIGTFKSEYIPKAG